MSFERIALGETSVTDITFVRLFASVNAQMTFQLVCIRTGVSAMRTLVRSFSCMTTHVSFQLGQFNTCIIAFCTTMRLLMSMAIANMPYKLAGGCECSFTILALMGPDTSMGVDVILKRSYRLETSFANATFVRSLLTVRLHVTREKVSFVACVIAVVTHMVICRPRGCCRHSKLLLLCSRTLRTFVGSLARCFGFSELSLGIFFLVEFFLFFVLLFIQTFNRSLWLVNCKREKVGIILNIYNFSALPSSKS